MSSKNGAPELVSMLQYMKDTRLNNPNILVRDSRILELDGIMTEVKASEEWEAVKMNILEIGIEKGAERKLRELVKKKLDKGYTAEQIADVLEESVDIIRGLIKELD